MKTYYKSRLILLDGQVKFLVTEQPLSALPSNGFRAHTTDDEGWESIKDGGTVPPFKHTVYVSREDAVVFAVEQAVELVEAPTEK